MAESQVKAMSIYLHFPCFDGVISAVLAAEYLRRRRGWETAAIIPVNYGSEGSWIAKQLAQPAVVVDFQYHPQAVFWADHHQTSFASKALKCAYQHRKSTDLLYNENASSCAEILWTKTYRSLREPRFREMVEWARRIDSARYNSVEEAVLGEAPALRINASMMNDQSTEYCQFLVTSLREQTLAEVANSKTVTGRYRSTRLAIKRGQRLFRSEAHIEKDGIVVFNVPERNDNTLVSRYAPYLAYPQAKYSIGIIPSGSGSKITAMRNPWRRFKSLPLGQIFSRYGGGGHQRVASVLVKNRQDAQKTLTAILCDLRNPDSAFLGQPTREFAGD